MGRCGTVVDHCGSLWDHCGSLWDHCGIVVGSLWIVVDHCGSFRVLVTTFGCLARDNFYSICD